jgi:hypothetical protein
MEFRFIIFTIMICTGGLVTNSNIVNIRKLDINIKYNFRFTVISISDDTVCKLDLPSEFKFKPKSEVELITSLLMSYFLSAAIFTKSKVAKENSNLGFVPRELLGESVILSICTNKNTGFTFEHQVPDSIKGNAGEVCIANSINNLLVAYEDSLYDREASIENITI